MMMMIFAEPASDTTELIHECPSLKIGSALLATSPRVQPFLCPCLLSSL